MSTDKTAWSRAWDYTLSDEVRREWVTSLQILAKPRSVSELLKRSDAIGARYYKPTMARGAWGYTRTDEVRKG